MQSNKYSGNRLSGGLAVALIACAGILAGCSSSLPAGRPIVSFGGDTVDVTDPVDRARVQLTMGQFGLAVETLQSALHREPQSGRILNLLAVAYDKIGRPDLADRYFAESLQIDPHAAVTLNNWGYSKLLRGDRAAALDLFQQAAAKTPDDPVVLANLALAQGTAGGTGTGVAMAPENQAAVVDEVANATPAARGPVQILTATPCVVRQASGVQLLVTLQPVGEGSNGTWAAGASGAVPAGPRNLMAQRAGPDAPAMHESMLASFSPTESDLMNVPFVPAGPVFPTDGIAMATVDAPPEGEGPSIRLVSHRTSPVPGASADAPPVLIAMAPDATATLSPIRVEGTGR
jgi:hypothetical protein